MTEKIPSKTERELKALARDIYHGLVFTSAQCANPDDVSMVFMFLALMDRNEFSELVQETGLVYEYMYKAGPHSVNGLPSFMSMKLLNREDTARLIPLCEQYEAIQREWSGDETLEQVAVLGDATKGDG